MHTVVETLHIDSLSEVKSCTREPPAGSASLLSFIQSGVPFYLLE